MHSITPCGCLPWFVAPVMGGTSAQFPPTPHSYKSQYMRTIFSIIFITQSIRWPKQHRLLLVPNQDNMPCAVDACTPMDAQRPIAHITNL